MVSTKPYPSSNECSPLFRLQETRQKYHCLRSQRLPQEKLCWREPGTSLLYLYSQSGYKQVLQIDIHGGHVVIAEFSCLRTLITSFSSFLWRSKYYDNATFSFNQMLANLSWVFSLSGREMIQCQVTTVRCTGQPKGKATRPSSPATNRIKTFPPSPVYTSWCRNCVDSRAHQC